MLEKQNMDDTTKKDDTSAEVYIVSELGKLRYEIEHNVMKKIFFNYTKKFIMKIREEGVAYDLYKSLFEANGMDFPYEKDEFSMDELKLGDNTFLLLLELPKPEYVPLCYRMYFIYKDDFSDTAMFTIERGISGGFLCSWNKEGVHNNYLNMASPEWKENIVLMKLNEASIIEDLYNNRATRAERDYLWN